MERKEIRKEVERLKSKRLSEQSCMEIYVRALANKSVDCEQNEAKESWTQMKEALISNTRKVCSAIN